MGIKCMTSDADIARHLEDKAQRLRNALIERLMRMGEIAVTEARENHRYKDRTGNLTSSIGYCVLDNGSVIIESSFNVAKGVWKDDKGHSHPYSGDAGSKEGREFLHSLISAHSTGLVLIIVAGMNYASYVEAMNLNVLDSAEQLVERELPGLLKQLNIDNNE